MRNGSYLHTFVLCWVYPKSFALDNQRACRKWRIDSNIQTKWRVHIGFELPGYSNFPKTLSKSSFKFPSIRYKKEYICHMIFTLGIPVSINVKVCVCMPYFSLLLSQSDLKTRLVWILWHVIHIFYMHILKSSIYFLLSVNILKIPLILFITY